jgi:CBS-domain-containing membrane protein
VGRSLERPGPGSASCRGAPGCPTFVLTAILIALIVYYVRMDKEPFPKPAASPVAASVTRTAPAPVPTRVEPSPASSASATRSASAEPGHP